MKDLVRKTRKCGLASGFSLIEVLVALLVLAVSSLALFSTLGFSKRLQTETVDINECGEAANAIIESFRKFPYIGLEDEIPPGEYVIEQLTSVSYTDSNSNVFKLMEAGMATNLRLKITDRRMQEKIIVQQAADAIQVTVQIAPQNDLENPVVQMVTFITKNGINFRS
jgi:prepilin-type N-terminal cleavage/methylation domain-containing protein